MMHTVQRTVIIIFMRSQTTFSILFAYFMWPTECKRESEARRKKIKNSLDKFGIVGRIDGFFGRSTRAWPFDTGEKHSYAYKRQQNFHRWTHSPWHDIIQTNCVSPQPSFNLVYSPTFSSGRHTQKKLTLQILLWYDYHIKVTDTKRNFSCAHIFFLVFLCLCFRLYAPHNFSSASKADFMHAKALLSIRREMNDLVAFLVCFFVIPPNAFLAECYSNTVAE